MKTRSNVSSVRRLSPNAKSDGFAMGFKKGPHGDVNAGYGTQDEKEIGIALDDFDNMAYQTQWIEFNNTPQVSRTLTRGNFPRGSKSTKNGLAR